MNPEHPAEELEALEAERCAPADVLADERHGGDR